MELALDQRITTRLSLAVSLIDDFTQNERIIGKVKVAIPGLNLAASENPDGYYNFLDVVNGIYTIKTEADFYIDNEIKNFTIPRTVDYSFPGGGGAAPGSDEAVLADISGLFDGDVLEFDNGIDPPERRRITLDLNPATKKIHWDSDPQGGLKYNYPDSASIRLPGPENLILNIRLKPNPLYPFPSGATLVRGSVQDPAGDPISEAEVELVGDALNTRTTDNGDFVLYFPASQGDGSIQIRVKPRGSPPKTVNAEVRKGRTTSLTITYP